MKQEDAMKNPLKRIPFPIALIIPIEIVMMFLLIFPLIVEIWVSLTNWTPLLGTNWWHAKFIGLKNYYQILFKDNRFIMAVLRTTLIATVCVVV
jgi:multiple sugar transport system permease protein